MASSTENSRLLPDCLRRRCGGQAMVESLVVMLVTLLLLFSLLQVAHAFASREILRHAAARAARARTVGFNYWMCEKVMRVATIPVAGRMIEPQVQGSFDSELSAALSDKKKNNLWDWSLGTIPRSERGILEAARIPDYLASENAQRAMHILDYDNWDKLSASGLGGGTSSPITDDNTLSVRIRQRYPLTIFVRMLNDWVGYLGGGINGTSEITLSGEYNIESHYPLYIDERGY